MANLKETEFAQMGKRNLVALKQFLENELTNIEKLKKLDEFEEDFIKHGRSYFFQNGNSPRFIAQPWSTIL